MSSSHTDQQPQLTVGIALSVGQARRHKPNQDSVGIYSDYCDDADLLFTKGRLFVVADGMGGAAGGKEASEMAVETVIDSYYEDPDLEIMSCLERTIQEANSQIKQHGQANSSLRGLGTTIVIAVIRGRDLVVANVGDSRAYLLRQGILQQLSLDHTSVQEQMREGLLTPEEAATHPRRHVLSRNLGSRPHVQPDFATKTLVDRDTLLLCSDGLSGPVSDEEIVELLQRLHGQAAADALVELANKHGGPDNISAIVVYVGEPVTTTNDYVKRPPTPLSDQTEAPAGSPAGDGVTARPGVHRRPARQGRWWVAISAGVVLLLLAVVALRNPFSSLGEQIAAPLTNPSAAPAAVATAMPQDAQLIAAPTRVPQPTTSATNVPTTTPSSTPADTGDWLHRLEHKGDVRSVAFMPDGLMLASVSRDSIVKLWQVRDGKLLSVIFEKDTHVESIGFALDGQTLAAGFLDGTIKLWRLGAAAGNIAEPETTSVSSVTENSVTTLPSDVFDQTATAQEQSPVITSTLINTMTGHSNAVTSLAFTADGRMLASAARDGTVRLWKVSDGSFVNLLLTNGEDVASLAFAPDGKMLAIVFENGSLKLWGLDTVPISERELVGYRKSVTSVAFSPDGQTLAVGSRDDTIELWHLNDRRDTLLNTLADHNDEVESVVFAPDGRMLAATSPDGTMKLWQVSTGSLVHVFMHADGVNSVAFAPNGRMLATGSSQGIVTLWQVPDDIR